MPNKQHLLILVDDLESAWERVRTKGVVGATAEDYAAIEQATRSLRRAFFEYQERHGLPAPMLFRWLDQLADGVELAETKEPVEPVTGNPMLLKGSQASPPPVEITLRSTHVPNEMIDHFQTLKRPSDLPIHNAKGWWGGLEWKSFASLRDEIEDLPEPADELLTVAKAVKRYRVSESTLYSWIEQKKLTVYRKGDGQKKLLSDRELAERFDLR